MRTKLAIGIGAAVLVLVIVFCALPLKEVAYETTEQYQASETYYTSEPYTERIPYTVQVPYTRDHQTYWKTVTRYRYGRKDRQRFTRRSPCWKPLSVIDITQREVRAYG